MRTMDTDGTAFTRTMLIWATALALAAAVGCARQQQRPDPLVVGDLKESTGTIVAVDASNGLVSIRDDSGRYTTVQTGPNVRNFEQVRVGDRVSVGYFEGIIADVRPPGEQASPPEESVARARSAPGERPAGAIGRTVTSTVTIEAVDEARNTVTFRRQDGLVRTIAVHRPESQQFIRKLRKGDEVQVTYTEAIAVALNPTE